MIKLKHESKKNVKEKVDKTQRKNKFQVARFAALAVLPCCCADNVTSYRQTDKQVSVFRFIL
jgi:hypothetical protein